MKYKEYMNTLFDDKDKGVYLFDSEEEFLNDTIIEQVRNKINIKDFNFIELKASKDIEEIKNSYETYPVMEEVKYIIWKDIDLSKNSIKDYQEILDVLIKDFESFPDFARLLIFSKNPPYKASKFYKSIKKHGTIVEIDRLSQKELENFIGLRFQRNGKKIQRSLVREIVNRFSYLSRDSKIDLYEVVNTVDKIIANSRDQRVLEKDVFDQLDEVININIFNLLDALSKKNKKQASDLFLKMTHSGEDLFMIYHMIIRQIRNLIGIKSLQTRGYNDSFLMKNLGIGNFELKKLKNFAKNFILDELFDIHSRIFDMELRQKSQDFDMKMELLILISKFGN